MSGLQPRAGRSLAAVDPQSARRAEWFVIRVLALMALTAGPCLTGARPWQDAAGLLSLACAVGATVSTFFAAIRREPLGRGSLNGWDETLAFIAVGHLAQAAVQLHG